jgi:hypothetical protein
MASFGQSAIHSKERNSADQISVFVTGNANKLKEVKAILAAGDSGIEVTSKAVDGKSPITGLKLTISPRSSGYNARGSHRKVPSCRRCPRHGVRD